MYVYCLASTFLSLCSSTFQNYLCSLEHQWNLAYHYMRSSLKNVFSMNHAACVMTLQGLMLYLGSRSLPALPWFSWIWAELEMQIPDQCGNGKGGCCPMVKCVENDVNLISFLD